MILELTDVSKSYGALRPLRLNGLALDEGSTAIVGLDLGAAEILINLITGATLPERGEVRIFGRATSDIADSSDWLATVDHFGIVSDRAVLLDQLSVVQNLAMPFTLDVEPPPADVRARAEALAREVGIEAAAFDKAIAAVDDAIRTRVRLGRALALEPRILLLEHATAALTREAAKAFGRDVRDVAARRGVVVLALTADDSFAREVADTVLVHNPATGGLTEKRRGWFRTP
jgi:ABC-type transporter Mla maintaining outer membrane lipid asymmetry ATPase subunit MlaF